MTTTDNPQVFIVEILADDDYESRFELAHVFTSKDAADTYAASIVAPQQARVYPMPLLSVAPATVTTYTLTASLFNDPQDPRAGLVSIMDPATEVPEVEQVDEHDPNYARIAQTAPVTVTREVYERPNVTQIKVVGTDKDAVQAAFVQAYQDLDARRRDTKGGPA